MQAPVFVKETKGRRAIKSAAPGPRAKRRPSKQRRKNKGIWETKQIECLQNKEISRLVRSWFGRKMRFAPRPLHAEPHFYATNDRPNRKKSSLTYSAFSCRLMLVIHQDTWVLAYKIRNMYRCYRAFYRVSSPASYHLDKHVVCFCNCKLSQMTVTSAKFVGNIFADCSKLIMQNW